MSEPLTAKQERWVRGLLGSGSGLGADEASRLLATLDESRAEVERLRNGPCCPTCSDMEHNPESRLSLMRFALEHVRDALDEGVEIDADRVRAALAEPGAKDGG